MNAPAPIPKDQLNAALSANPNAIVRTQAQADLTRPIVPVPNGFRHMDVLTNEGRSWYQGIRFSGVHRTTPLVVTASYTFSSAEDLLNHWFSPENSTDPESDRGPTGASTPHNLVTSVIVERARQRPDARRLAPEHGDAQPERLAVHDSLCRRPGRLRVGRRRGLQLARLPGEHAGRTQHRARHVHQLRRPHAGETVRGRRQDHIEFRADVFNVFNNQNLLAGGYINLVGNPRFGQHTGGSNVLPGRQFQFATDVSLLGSDDTGRCEESLVALVLSAVVYGHRAACRPQSKSRPRARSDRARRHRHRSRSGQGAGHHRQLPEVRGRRPLRRRHVPSHRQDGQPAGEHRSRSR